MQDTLFLEADLDEAADPDEQRTGGDDGGRFAHRGVWDAGAARG